MSKNILVIAAHPDDEILGCGGTMARHVSSGDHVHVLYMTNGVGARDACENEVNLRMDAAIKACETIGIKSHKFGDFPDNQMDKVPLLQVVRFIEESLEIIRPSIIYTHHQSDLNIDHQLTFKAAITACRPQPGFSVKEFYSFEVLSSTEWGGGEGLFRPSHFVNISAHIEIKCDALKFYKKEMREPPHSRSFLNVKNLAALRGASVGLDYAEAFCVIRTIT